MSTFDSPIARCEAIHEMVLMDETQAECACEHDCPADRKCPLSGYFTKMSGVVEYPIQKHSETDLNCFSKKLKNPAKTFEP